MYIPVILGTAREGCLPEKAASFMLHEALQAGLRSELVDAQDYRIEATNNTEQIPQAQKS